MKLNSNSLISFVLQGVSDMPAVDNFSGEININVKVHCGGVTDVKIGSNYILSIPKKTKNIKKVLEKY